MSSKDHSWEPIILTPPLPKQKIAKHERFSSQVMLPNPWWNRNPRYNFTMPILKWTEFPNATWKPNLNVFLVFNSKYNVIMIKKHWNIKIESIYKFWIKRIQRFSWSGIHPVDFNDSQTPKKEEKKFRIFSNLNVWSRTIK